MLLTLFIIILTIAVLLIAFGELTKEGVYSLGGLLFLFLLGITILLPGNLQIPNGDNVTITTNEITGVTTATVIPIQTDFSDTLSHSMGVWISLISIFGFAIKLGQIKAGFNKDE
jgi:hypothetical protein